MISTFAAAVCAMSLMLQVERKVPEAPSPKLSCIYSDTSRIIAIKQFSDSEQSDAGYVTVFEFLGEGKSLRKLYEMKLATSKHSWVNNISPDGRFFITRDETSAMGTGPFSLVIYDLARREYTAYSIKDFMTNDVIKTLNKHTIFPGLNWYGPRSAFSRDSTKYYPTEYTYYKDSGAEQQIPLVEVNLLSRTAKVIPKPSIDPDDISRDEGMDGWICSDENVKTEHTLLPQSFTRVRNGLIDRKYELTKRRSEYVPVQENLPVQ
ncbi:MAG: hypothetical protein ACO1RA_21915 [Planctomycetaceae bacterium]